MASDQRANQVGANLRVVRDSHFWQPTPPATELQVGDSSSTLGQTWPQKQSQSASSKNFSWGSKTN